MGNANAREGSMNGTAGAIRAVMEALPAASLWLPVGISSEVVRRSWPRPRTAVTGSYALSKSREVSLTAQGKGGANDMESALFHECL